MLLRRRHRPLVSAAALLTACLLVLAPAAIASAAAPASTAYIRVAHLVPGFGPVTMSATLTAYDGSKTPLTLTPSASYGAVSGYQALPVGYYAIAVRPVGAPASSPPALTGSLQATPGGAYTIAGLGASSGPRIGAIKDDIARPPADKARVRVINAAVPGQAADVSLADGTALASKAPFSEPTSYSDVAAGSTTITASADGKTASAPADLVAGDVYTLLLLDDGKGGIVVHPVTDAAGPSTTPTGGAATGGGGLVTHDATTRRLTAAGAGLAVVGGAGMVLARGLRGSRRRAGARHAATARG